MINYFCAIREENCCTYKRFYRLNIINNPASLFLLSFLHIYPFFLQLDSEFGRFSHIFEFAAKFQYILIFKFNLLLLHNSYILWKLVASWHFFNLKCSGQWNKRQPFPILALNKFTLNSVALGNWLCIIWISDFNFSAICHFSDPFCRFCNTWSFVQIL